MKHVFNLRKILSVIALVAVTLVMGMPYTVQAAAPVITEEPEPVVEDEPVIAEPKIEVVTEAQPEDDDTGSSSAWVIILAVLAGLTAISWLAWWFYFRKKMGDKTEQQDS